MTGSRPPKARYGPCDRFSSPSPRTGWRLEFAAFSVKSMRHDFEVRRHRWIGAGRTPAVGVCARRPAAGAVVAAPAEAQMFSDRPPPVPPASVPEPTGPAMNLAPPSGPASDPKPAGAIDAAVHCAADHRRRAAGGRAAGGRDPRPGRAVADRALRQRPAGHHQRTGVAGLFRPAGRHRHLQIDPRGSRRHPQYRAAARQLCRPCRVRAGQRGPRGDA